MKNILAIVIKKPCIILLFSFAYLLAVSMLKWGIRPTYDAALFVAGGIVGIYLLDGAEAFFNIHPSPFRSIVFTAGLMIVGLYIVTSSGSVLASGLTLALYLQLLLWMTGEWEVKKNTDSWYRMISGNVGAAVQYWILLWCIGVFIAESIWFIR